MNLATLLKMNILRFVGTLEQTYTPYRRESLEIYKQSDEDLSSIQLFIRARDIR